MSELHIPLSVLPDPDMSRAVLIGVSEYEHKSMDALPAVARNVETLGTLLTSPDLWGLKPEHCVTLLNPRSSHEVLDAVHTAATEASDALLVYFAGHGLLDDRSELYLALSDADQKRIFRGVRYDDMRREVVGTARRCNGKVVILDCCFSGRALQGGMSGPTEVVNHASIDGTYLMTASAETSMALAPIGEEYTAFTGALLDNLINGLPDGPDVLDLETLFFHVRARMQERNFPIPQQRTRNGGRAIAIARNRRGSASGTATHKPIRRQLPSVPDGLEIARRPRELAAAAAQLMHDERPEDAHALLAAAGARLEDQSIAALTEVLDEPARRTLIGGAALRLPAEVRAIMSALRETDQPGPADELLMAVARRPTEEAAALAHELRLADADKDVITLLDAALTQTEGQPAIIGLVNDLWLAGLRHDVDALLQRAARRLPAPDVLALADELRGAGRDQAAYGLYIAAVDALAARPPADIAQLVGETHIEHPEGSALIATAAIRACDSPSAVLALNTAFRATDQHTQADATLDHAAASLAPRDVVVVVDTLVDEGEYQAALQLCAEATRNHPSHTQTFVRALHEGGRPIDAKRLLETAIEQLPITDIVQQLVDSDSTDTLRRLLAAARSRPADDQALIAAELLAARGADAVVEFATQISKEPRTVGPLLTAISQRGNAELVVLVSDELLRLLHPEASATLLTTLPNDVAHPLTLRALHRGQPFVGELVASLRGTTDGPPPRDSFYALLQSYPADRAHLLLPTLRHAGLDAYADALTEGGFASSQSADDMAITIRELRSAGDHTDADRVLQHAANVRAVVDQRAIVVALHRQSADAEIPQLLTWLRDNGGLGLNNLADMLRREGLPQYAAILAEPLPPAPEPERKRFWPRG